MLSKFGIKFATKSVRRFYEEAVTPKITNDWYEGQITDGKADRLKIKTITESQGLQDYTPGTALTLGSLTDVEASLIPNQRKGYYFEIDDVNKYESYVDDEKENVLDDKVNALHEAIDAYVLGLYSDVAAGNRVGVSRGGTVTIAAATGIVTGGTAGLLTTAMLGRGFKVTGMTSWYRVKSISGDGTTLVIEDDKDDITSAYTGGAFASAVDFEAEAETAVALTTANIYGKIVGLKVKLDQAKAPKSNRWLVVEANVGGLLLQSAQLIPAVPVAYEEVVKNGHIGMISGFRVYQSEQIEGGNTATDGLHILAGHIAWMTFASAFVQSTIEEDLPGEFGKAYKGLNCYGGKVIDERRKMGAELYCYVP